MLASYRAVKGTYDHKGFSSCVKLNSEEEETRGRDDMSLIAPQPEQHPPLHSTW